MSAIDHIIEQAKDRDEAILAVLRGLWEVAMRQGFEIEQLKQQVQELRNERT